MSLNNELCTLCAELGSENAATRNKSIERLDSILATSKNEIFTLLRHRNAGGENTVSWTEMFKSATQAILKHSAKIDATPDAKKCQTLRNKNYIFRSVVTKLIEYNLEGNSNFLPKAILLNTFFDGLSDASGTEHFGSLFLHILERGIYKSPTHVCNLKVNEYSRILSQLFEVNVNNNQILRFEVLTTIVKTIELAAEHVQVEEDLICYLPELNTFAQNAIYDKQKTDVIRLYYLFVTQLATDYRHTICTQLQEILLVIQNFYSFLMKPEAKATLFQSLYVSLCAIYPRIHKGDISTSGIPLVENWPKTLQKLKSIIDIEIRERKPTLNRGQTSFNDKCLEDFVKMATLVIYMTYWHTDAFNGTQDELQESRHKIAKTSEKLEHILKFVQPDESTCNEIWLAILSELMCNQEAIVNVSNFKQVLNSLFNMLHNYSNSSKLHHLRICFTSILGCEQTFISQKCISANHYQETWLKLVEFMINESSSNEEIVAEQHLLLQSLIAHGKLQQQHCVTLLNSFISSTTMKRTECIATLRQMFIHADQCGLDKTSEIIGRILTWIHESNEKIVARNVLLNITPVDTCFLADTCAIAVINFLDETQLYSGAISDDTIKCRRLQLLSYKYSRKFVCLEEHAKDLYPTVQDNRLKATSDKKNCLFQSNYELLMRILNFETAKELTCRHMLQNLSSLEKVASLMKKFLDYGVFTTINFTQCPLVKRIGFFLSHLEFQLKSNTPRNFEPSDLLDVLLRLERICTIFTSNAVLLEYLENQPLKELIGFVGMSLKFSASKQLSNDIDDWSKITCSSLKILAKLCASGPHWKDALPLIASYKLNITTDLDTLLSLVEVFCSQRFPYADAANWFVEKLKIVFQLFYTNIRVISIIVDMLPAIFAYVEHFDNPREDMLIALNSLLKVAFKKSYPRHLTANLISKIRHISRTCGAIFSQENFTTICLSTAKFISLPSLDVQFSTINTITALLDVSWLRRTDAASKTHFDFCEQLYSHIGWKNLPTSTKDLLQNTNAVTVQVLVSLFVFSSYYQEVALQELAYFCALRKLNEADLVAFQQTAQHFNCSLPELTKPYLRNVIHYWTAKQYPILKFPFFLCCNSLTEFIQTNLPEIVSCMLLYGKADSLKVLHSYGTEKEFLQLAFPVAYSLRLPYSAECAEARNQVYKKHIEKLADNLNAYRVDLLNSSGGSNIQAEYIYSIVELFRDDSQFHEMLGFPIFFHPAKWFHISHFSLRACLAYYIVGSANEDNIARPFSNLLTDNPLVLVRVLGALKTNCCNCVFFVDSLKYLYICFIVGNLIIDSHSPSASSVTRNCIKYFIRDIIFFILHYLESAQRFEMQKTALVFLRHFLNKSVIGDEFWLDILQEYLNFVCRTLIYIATETASSPEIEKMTMELLNSLVLECKIPLAEAIALLDEFPTKESFDELRKIHHALQSQESQRCEQDLPSIVSSFLRTRNRGSEGLKSMRHYVSKNKSQLHLPDNLLYDLIKRLIELLRSSSDMDISLEAAKCLGEIGAIKIEGISYYMQTDVSFYENPMEPLQARESFVQCMLVVLEKLVLVFDRKTHNSVCGVAQYLINSKHGRKQLASFPYFNVFLDKNTQITHDFDVAAPIDWLSVLKTTEAMTYNEWICTFSSKLFKNCGYKAFEELSAQNSHFAEASLLPFVKLLMLHKDSYLKDLLAALEYFFAKLAAVLNLGCVATSGATEINVIFKDKRVVSKFLDICECVRIHNEWKLQINLLNVAKACNYCQAYFMSIMYLELWALEEKSREIEKPNNKILANDFFQDIAKKAYECIGCRNAISGFLNPLKSRLDFLSLDNNWSDILLEAGGSEQICDHLYTSVLKRNGMLALAGLSQSSNLKDYEVCWRLGQWDTVVEGHSKLNTLNDLEHEFEKHHFNALKCLFNREENNSLAAISNARQCVLSILKEISVECLQSVYKYLSWLHLLQQSEDFCQIQFTNAAPVDMIFQKWQAELGLKYGNFHWKEQVISHQIVLFKTAGIRANRKIEHFYKENPAITCLLKCVKECKVADEINLAIRNIALLKSMDISDIHIKASVLLEDADICMKTGKSQIAKATLEHILLTDDYTPCLQRVPALRKYGEYLMESNMETFDFVLSNLFQLSMEVLNGLVQANVQNCQTFSHLLDWETFEIFEQGNRKQNYQAIAKYADREYEQLNTYEKSAEYQMKRRIIKENREAADLVGRQNKDRDKNIGAIYMKKFANLDEKEVHSIEKKRTEYLCIAMENYMQFCQIDEAMSCAAIYRIIALWFANKQNSTLYTKVKAHIAAVPSYKFICALNQITARLNSQNREFIGVLKELLVRCVQDHPHQTLYHLYPLIFAFHDGSTSNKSNDRIQIARETILKAKNVANSNCAKQLEVMFPALIEFANVAVTDNKNASLDLNDKLRRLKNLDAVQCPTIDLPVCANKKYNITTILKWEQKVDLVGGINAPKKLTCLCSDGRKRLQLLKGKDDLRQDAVMQQVFSMINDLLRVEPETAERQLVLRTYKVMPLSMRCGILEWCENTIPIGVYLAGDSKGGAHKKYRPNDYTVAKCRQLSLQNLKADTEKRYQVFMHICANMQPVLHYFLLERFLVPGVWFERRLAYTNSVATTSIVGYVVGLGDRHTQNILIDEKTGELIHIDFGIAFEQGKIMPTPETVPFRLTRDLVAPMGVCETNGVFKKSCEATMCILRRNQAVITTILEVLLYDPLYIWKVVPQLSNTSGDSSASEEKNLMAQRALLCVQNKLEGKQAGILGTSDIDVQVQRLINEAILKRNLCQLYPGWDPYL